MIIYKKPLHIISPSGADHGQICQYNPAKAKLTPSLLALRPRRSLPVALKIHRSGNDSIWVGSFKTKQKGSRIKVFKAHSISVSVNLVNIKHI